MAADGAQAPQGDEKDDDAEGDAEGDAPGEAAADGRADDAGAPKGDAKGDGKKKRKKKKRGEGPARERPAFNVSDVVFGKIVEVNDDAIFIDLSGKANAIFDKLELVLPEDSIDVEDEARHAEELAESIVAGTIDPDVVLAPAAALEAAPVDAAAEAAPAPAAADEGARGKIIRIVRASSESAQPAAPAPANGEGAAEGSTDASAAAPADATPDAVVDGAAASEVEAPAAAAPDESGADAPREQAASTEADGDAKSGSVLQLPRVVLEPGAPFVGVVRNDGVRGGHVVLFGVKNGDAQVEDIHRVVMDGLQLHGIVGRQIFGTWEITRKLLEDRANGIQDAVWDVILNRGEGTLVPIESWEKESFEAVIKRHPKALIRFAG